MFKFASDRCLFFDLYIIYLHLIYYIKYRCKFSYFYYSFLLILLESTSCIILQRMTKNIFSLTETRDRVEECPVIWRNSNYARIRLPISGVIQGLALIIVGPFGISHFTTEFPSTGGALDWEVGTDQLSIIIRAYDRTVEMCSLIL